MLRFRLPEQEQEQEPDWAQAALVSAQVQALVAWAKAPEAWARGPVMAKGREPVRALSLTPAGLHHRRHRRHRPPEERRSTSVRRAMLCDRALVLGA
jgi:hypothetical protein